MGQVVGGFMILGQRGVTVDTFHSARGSRGPKVTTVTGMASTQPPPPPKKKVTKKKVKK